MKNKDKSKNIERRSLVKVIGSAAIAGLAMNASTTNAQVSERTQAFQPSRHNLDSWMGELPGSHRVFIDTSTTQGGIDAMRYAANILNAHKNAYSGRDSDYAMIACYRHGSTPFAFSEANWEKYGEIFAEIMQLNEPDAGAAPRVNPLRVPNPVFTGTTIDDLANRGVQFAICSSATRFFSGMIAARTGSTAEAVFDELTTNAIPNSRFVPAGVMAMTRAQEYGYSLLYSAG